MTLDPLASPSERAHDFIRGRINELQALPSRDEGWWQPADTEFANKLTPTRLYERDLVERRNRLHPSGYEYRTLAETQRQIKAEIERRDTLPCGHTGLTNHGNGEYGCGYDPCSERFDRETVTEAIPR